MRILICVLVSLMVGISGCGLLLSPEVGDSVESVGGELNTHILIDIQYEIRSEVARILGEEWTKHQPAIDMALNQVVQRALDKLAGNPTEK